MSKRICVALSRCFDRNFDFIYLKRVRRLSWNVDGYVRELVPNKKSIDLLPSRSSLTSATIRIYSRIEEEVKQTKTVNAFGISFLFQECVCISFKWVFMPELNSVFTRAEWFEAALLVILRSWRFYQMTFQKTPRKTSAWRPEADAFLNNSLWA